MTKKELRKNNKGFSLVELIVVIAIMAVLVGVLAPQFIKYVENSRQSTDIQNVQEVKSAIEVYAAATADNMNGSVVFKANAAATVSGTGITNALADAGVTAAELKSSKWGDVTLSVTQANDGKITIKVANTNSSTLNFATKSGITAE